MIVRVKTIELEGGTLTRIQGLNGDRTPLSIVRENGAKTIVACDTREDLLTVTFLIDGKHIASGGWGGKIQHWQVEDGEEVGTSTDVGSGVCSIVMSADGKWVIIGKMDGRVTVWDTASGEKATEFEAHHNWVRAVDVSPDAMRIATGSSDFTACIWSLSTGRRLLGPFEHDLSVWAVKFSPDGCLVATATAEHKSVRVYDSRHGHGHLVDIPVAVSSRFNSSLAWSSNSKQLFALSDDGNIHCLDISTKTTLAKWPMHSSNKDAMCIALASDGTLIAASAGSSVSFWNITTQEQIGAVLEHTHTIRSMAIFNNNILAVGGYGTISLRDICDMFRPTYLVTDITKSTKTIGELLKLTESRQQAQQEMVSLHSQEKIFSDEIAHLTETIWLLRRELAQTLRAENDQKDGLNKTIRLLRADLQTQEKRWEAEIARLEQTNEELRGALAEVQRIIDGAKKSSKETLRGNASLRRMECSARRS